MESTPDSSRLRPARPRTSRRIVSILPRRTDDAGWERMLARHGGHLRRRIARTFAGFGIAPRREMVDDVAQEVYCRLLAGNGRRLRLCRAQRDVQLEGFLGRVAQRVVIDRLRAGSAAKRGGSLVGLDWSRSGGLVQNLVDPAGTPEDRLLVRERLAAFLAACRRAGARLRGRGVRDERLVRLALFEGRTSREISRRLRGRLTVGGIDSRLYRLRGRLASSGLDMPYRGSVRRRRRR